MAKGFDGKVAAGLATAVMKLTDMAIAGGTASACDATQMAFCACAGPLGSTAGILSADFPDAPAGTHPAVFANPDTILFCCLLAARSLSNISSLGAMGVDMGPDIYLAAIDDFKRLSSTPIDRVVRADLLELARSHTDSAVVSVEALMAKLGMQS